MRQAGSAIRIILTSSALKRTWVALVDEELKVVTVQTCQTGAIVNIAFCANYRDLRAREGRHAEIHDQIKVVVAG